MSSVAKFHDSLAVLDGQLTALAALTEQPRPPEDEVLVAARWTIVRTLAEIAAVHEKFLLAPLEASGDKTRAAQARAISDAMQETMRRLIEHAERWPAQAVRTDWLGFRRALPATHRVIRDHFAWQARVVPPMLATLEGASATPKRNWTRPIWAVQESFSGE